MARQVARMKTTAKKKTTKKAVPKTAKKTTVKKTVKKAVAAKVTTGRSPRKSGGNGRAAHLTKRDLQKYREQLLTIRAELLGDYTTLSNDTLGKSSQDGCGNLSKMPIHMADVGSDTFNQDMDIQLLEGERQRLKRIDAALQRMVKGTYGVCLHSGKPIPKARLAAIPYVRYTVEAQEELEKNGLLDDE